MSTTMTLLLPFPPSVNGYWRAMLMPTRGRKPTAADIRQIISEKGRDYRKEVLKLLPAQLPVPHLPILGPITVHLIERPADKRKRDLDNYTKALFDALTHGRVWGDDSQIKRITHEWYGLHLLYRNVPASPYVLDPGMLALEITNLETL